MRLENLDEQTLYHDRIYGFKQTDRDLFEEDILIKACIKRLETKNRICDWTEFVDYYLQIAAQTSRTFSTKEELSAAYIYYWCWIRHNDDLRNKLDYQHFLFTDIIYFNYCPNPCMREQCDFIKHAIKNTCTNLAFSRFQNDFNCSCEQPFYMWNQENSTCDLRNVCIQKQPPPLCKNDSICIFIDDQEPPRYECQCTTNTMGFDCSLPRDACIEAHNKSHPSGNLACANGICIGQIGTNEYSCKCRDYFENDPQFDFANCHKYNLINRCQLCANGYCDADEHTPSCACFYGWSGKHCDVREYTWQNWNDWSECMPECSSERVRRRNRTCLEHLKLNIVENASCYESGKLTENSFEMCPVADIHSLTQCYMNGTWSDWSLWSACSRQCNVGYRERQRFCLYNLSHILSGQTLVLRRDCEGGAYMYKHCKLIECPRFSQENMQFSCILCFSLLAILAIGILFLHIADDNKLAKLITIGIQR